MDMTRFAILLDGPVADCSSLRDDLAGRRIIAADGGIRHAHDLALEVEAWVGDGDSTRAADADRFTAVERHDHPAAKASSDGELALALALERGADDILLCGATAGPRTDHVLFNLSMMMRVHLDGACAIIADNGIERHIPLSSGQTKRMALDPDCTFSVFGFTDLSGLSIAGAQWPLEEASVSFGQTLTLSNRTTAPLTVSLRQGLAMIIVQTAQ